MSSPAAFAHGSGEDDQIEGLYEYDFDSDVHRHLDFSEPPLLPLSTLTDHESDHKYESDGFVFHCPVSLDQGCHSSDPPPPPPPTEHDFNSITYEDILYDLLPEFDPLNLDPLLLPPPHEDVHTHEAALLIQEDGQRNFDIPQSLILVLDAACKGIDRSGAFSCSATAGEFLAPVFQSFEPDNLDCRNCMKLREVIYTNGDENVTFLIHGRLGSFSHFIFYIQKISEGVEPNYYQYNLLDVSGQSLEWVRSFIDLYQIQMSNGCILVKDLVSPFVDALYGGIKASIPSHSGAGNPSYVSAASSGSTSMSADSTIGSDFDNEGTSDVDHMMTLAAAFTSSAEVSSQPVLMVGAPRQEKARKAHIAVQRERVAKMTFEDLRQNFHLPIQKAAESLDICTTAVKTVCRRNNMNRWPYRLIIGIENKIRKLDQKLRSCNSPERVKKIQTDIIGQMQKRDKIYRC